MADDDGDEHLKYFNTEAQPARSENAYGSGTGVQWGKNRSSLGKIDRRGEPGRNYVKATTVARDGKGDKL